GAPAGTRGRGYGAGGAGWLGVSRLATTIGAASSISGGSASRTVRPAQPFRSALTRVAPTASGPRAMGTRADPRRRPRVGIEVDGDHARRAEPERGDREDAGPGADVEHRGPRRGGER